MTQKHSLSANVKRRVIFPPWAQMHSFLATMSPIGPRILLGCLLAGGLLVSQPDLSQGQSTPSGNTTSVPRVKASDQQGIPIDAAAERRAAGEYLKDLSSGSLVDRNLASATGYSGHQIDDMARMAKEEGVIIAARTTNADSMRHIRDGRAVPKPVTVKSKTINRADTYLGARPEDKGLVGHFEPKQPDRSKVPADLWDEVEKRYADRKKDFKEHQESIDDLVKKGKVIEKDGKLYAAVPNADGSLETKPFAGDIDAVYFKDAKTGELIAGERYKRVKNRWMGLPDKPGSNSFLERFKRAWSGDSGSPDYWTGSRAPGQHGAEANLVADLLEGLEEGTPEYNKALQKAQDLHAKLGRNHWGDGEVIIEMHPDGNLRRGSRFSKDSPLPDLHKAGAAADDLGDAAGAGNKLLDAVKASKAAKALQKALDTLDTLGNIADKAEAVAAILKLKDVYDTIVKAKDPSTSDKESEALFDQARKMAQEIIGDSSMFVLLEKFPLRFPSAHLPAAYLVWTIKCGFRDWGREEGTCTEDHYNAAIRAWDELFGDKLERDAQRAADAKAQCEAFEKAVREGRAKPRWPFTEKDVCDAIKEGWSTADMRDDNGEYMAQQCARLEGQIGVATTLIDQGNLPDAQNALRRARYWLGEFGAEACPGLGDRIADQWTRIANENAPQIAKAEKALSECQFATSLPIIGSLPENQREALMERWNQAFANEIEAKALIGQAKALQNRGQSKLAVDKLQQARKLNPCKKTMAEIDKALGPNAQKNTASLSKSDNTKEPAKAGGKDCDPAKVVSKSNLSDGFKAVEYKGATAWTGETNPDCPPFGPAAKRSDGDGAGGEPEKLDAPQKAACGRVAAELQRGRGHFNAGRVSDYRKVLLASARELDGLPDTKACADERKEIARGTGQADVLDNVIKATDRVLANCESRDMRQLSDMLAKTNHPHVTQLRNRLTRLASIATKVSQANTALAGGNKTQAASLYREAAAGLNLEPGLCKNLAQQVRDGQQRITTASLAPATGNSELAAAENKCKANLGSHAVAIPNPDSLTGFTCDCAEPYTLEASACVRQKSASELADAAHNVCRQQFGSAAYAQPNTPDFQKYGCLCGKGYNWNAGRTQCIQQTREQVMAEAHESCQKANNNSRARAAKYLGDGQWSCTIERSRSEIMADAHRSCQQANGNNRRVRAGKQLANGQWSCYIPGPRRVVTQHQPNYDAAAAAVAVILGGVNAVMQNRVSRAPHRSTGGYAHERLRSPDLCVDYRGRRMHGQGCP